MSDLQVPLNPKHDKIFLAVEHSGLTFGEINLFVSATCGLILSHSMLEPGDRVAILMTRNRCPLS